MSPRFMKYLLANCLSLALAGTPAPVLASPTESAEASPATIEATRQFDFVSTINGEAYRVQTAVPTTQPPPNGYPAIYVLDGSVLFGSFAGAARNRWQAHEIEPAVIIGIDGLRGTDRTLDFTAHDLTPREKRLIKDLGDNPKFGGYDRFFRVIQEEVRPRVAQMAPLDGKRAALFGWSLGGLFVVHTMFAHPDAFSTYLALSPSLWRTERSVFGEIPDFERHVSRDNLPVRLFLAVGGREQDVTKNPLTSVSDKDWAAEAAYGRMVGNVVDLHAALSQFFASRQANLAMTVFKGDTHNSVPWTALNPMLDFALPPTAP